MSDRDRPINDALFEALRLWGELARGMPPTRLKVWFPDGTDQLLSIPNDPRFAAITRGHGDVVPDRPVDQAIIEVLASLPKGETLTGQEVADRAGYSYAGWFRTRLTTMAKEGKIKSHGKFGFGPVVVVDE